MVFELATCQRGGHRLLWESPGAGDRDSKVGFFFQLADVLCRNDPFISPDGLLASFAHQPFPAEDLAR
jgi:hypothetical protein